MRQHLQLLYDLKFDDDENAAVIIRAHSPTYISLSFYYIFSDDDMSLQNYFYETSRPFAHDIMKRRIIALPVVIL